jgi:hypothetical protein
MASFAQFLGRRVTVQYRIGDVLLPASGTFAADSGRSIFLEQHVEQRGKRSYFRWEIPYRAIFRIEEAMERAETAQETLPAEPPPQSSAARAGASSASTASFLTFPQRPKTV